MRIALTILIGLHGIIHLFGFLKAFGISEFNALSQPISKTFGIFWGLSFVLFAITTILLSAQNNYWWIVSFIGAVLSQFLLFNYWHDAKFGSIINSIIIVSVLLAYSTYNFKKTISNERTNMLELAEAPSINAISEARISGLPTSIQTWLLQSGIMEKEPIYKVYLEQDLQLLMTPDQKDWSPAKAQQYFTIEPPAFNWSVYVNMNPLVHVVGRDKFENGQGEMTIKLLSIIPLADVKNNEKVNQATLQRYLAEMVWFPSSALSPYIIWEEINPTTAKATMEYNGTTGSGEFHFNKNGEFLKFMAMRYKDADAIKPTEWTVTATKTEKMNGINIPVELHADWKLESGNWTWLKLKITDIRYNNQ